MVYVTYAWLGKELRKPNLHILKSLLVIFPMMIIFKITNGHLSSACYTTSPILGNLHVLSHWILWKTLGHKYYHDSATYVETEAHRDYWDYIFSKGRGKILGQICLTIKFILFILQSHHLCITLVLE